MSHVDNFCNIRLPVQPCGQANQPLVVLGEPGLREIQRPKVAAVFTEFRFRSHAYNILENFMGPYLFSGVVTDPGGDIVSFYADQFPADDMARKVAGRRESRCVTRLNKRSVWMMTMLQWMRFY